MSILYSSELNMAAMKNFKTLTIPLILPTLCTGHFQKIKSIALAQEMIMSKKSAEIKNLTDAKNSQNFKTLYLMIRIYFTTY